jgi:polysaccharide pyruvyl transferase WcaK-like protein
LLNDTTANNHYGSRLVMRQIATYCEKVGIRIAHRVPRAEDWRAAKHIQHVDRAECVIVNGEGSMHGSRQNAARLALVADHCRRRGQKSFLINSVYENNSAEIARHLACFDLIFVRESRSQKALAAQGIAAEVAPDMSLSYVPAIHDTARQQRVLFTDSVNQDTSNRLYELSHEIPGAEFISLRAEQPRRSSFVGDWASVGAVKLMHGYAPKLWRKRAKAALKAEACRPEVITESLQQLLQRIAESRLIVTGRFHMICMALLTKTPFIAMPSNTSKIEGLLDDVGLPHRMAGDELSLDCVRELAGWHAGEPEKVETYLSHAQKAIAAMFDALRYQTRPATSRRAIS